MADEIEKYVDVPDGFLYCQTRGQGQDVILVNAGAADLRMWETTVSWLSAIARVTTFDYRDTGCLRWAMVGLQVANAYFFTLEDYLGSELDPPVKTRFGEIATPVSVLAGGRDFNSTRLWAGRLAREAPAASLTVIPEADHFPMLSAPKQFERFLRETLG
jgi:pimeloyl-ACP methyl ester carboxylesterase